MVDSKRFSQMLIEIFRIRYDFDFGYTKMKFRAQEGEKENTVPST